mgnify:CR=1 FL=1
MVALALVLTGVVFAETQGTIAERYQDALSRLERYLMNLQDDSVNITTLAEDFQKLGNYEGSNAFYYYTLGLADAAANNYTLIPMYIDALVINTSFDERLTNLRENGVNIPSVAEWAAYMKGRIAENEGNYAEDCSGTVPAVPELHGRAEPHSVRAGVESADLRGGDTCPDSGAYVCAE